MDWPGFYPADIAFDLGIFKKSGLDITIKRYANNLEIRKNMMSQERSDIAFGTFFDVILDNTLDANLRAIYIVDMSENADIIVAGNSINNIQELKGKTISYEGDLTFSHFFVHEILKQNKIDKNTFLKNILAKDVPNEIDKGTIQAGHSWAPYTNHFLAKKGNNILAYAKDFPGIITDTMFSTPQSINEKSESIKIFIEVFNKVQLELKENPDKYMSYLTKKYQLSPLEIREMINSIKITTLKDNKFMFSEFNELPSCKKHFELTIDFIKSLRSLKENFSYKNSVDNKFVNWINN